MSTIKLRHITYDRRQVNHPRSPYNRHNTQRHLGRTEGSPANRRQLNHKYQNFRTQVTQLLWNDQKQSSIRCKIFQDKFDRNGEETLAAHYLRYVNLAANLHPQLSEYDLLGTFTAHYPYEVQKCRFQ